MNIFRRLASQNDQELFDDVIPQNNEKQSLGKASVDESPNEKKESIFKRVAQKNEEKEKDKFDFLQTAKDIGQQVISKGVSGVGGSYGNILEALHLQPQKGATIPQDEQLNSIKAHIVDKMNRGEAPSYGEMLLLSEEGPIDLGSRLPTSPDIQEAIKSISGIGEGKTPSGRIAGRGAEFAGETLALPGGAGLKALLSSGGAGLAGQGIREAGGPELAAAGTEILGSIAPAAFSKKLIPSGKAAKDIVESGRKLGLSESQITPLIQGETKANLLSKIARKGTKTRDLFVDIKNNLGDTYSALKKSPDAQKAIHGSNRLKLSNDLLDVHTDLSKTLASSPDRKAALDFIETALDSINNKNITPEYLMNFWQDINRSVNWNSISGGKKALAALKKPIAEALEKSSPKLAKDFEMTNNLYSKYSQISKKLKPNIIDSVVNKAEILGLPAATGALMFGNPWALSGLASGWALRMLGREMLINPYFQNIAKKLVVNFNQSSVKGVEHAIKNVEEYMSNKYPDKKWDFLLDDKLEPND